MLDIWLRFRGEAKGLLMHRLAIHRPGINMPYEALV